MFWNDPQIYPAQVTIRSDDHFSKYIGARVTYQLFAVVAENITGTTSVRTTMMVIECVSDIMIVIHIDDALRT